jgi:hypothetical protein
MVGEGSSDLGARQRRSLSVKDAWSFESTASPGGEGRVVVDGRRARRSAAAKAAEGLERRVRSCGRAGRHGSRDLCRCCLRPSYLLVPT